MTFGKEGPLVTISAAWAHLVSHYLKLNQQLTRVLVASGAAAGLASAFNTPIAAVIFTIEEILGELKTKYLGFVILTAVIGSVTAFKLNGNISTFTPVHYKFKIEWHLIFYLALGLIMALKGVYFIRLIIFFKDFKKKFFKNEYLYIIFVLCLIAVASNFTVEVLGDGIGTINRMLLGSELLSTKSLIILLVLRFFFATTSYSTGLSGGLFMPVLMLGAIGGNLVGLLLVHLGVEGIQVGAFTLLGMTSLLVAVIRTPFTAFVLLFEMTLDYELILPLMVSSISAFWVASRLSPSSVYEEVSAYEGVHLPTPEDGELLEIMNVEECMSREVKSLDGNKTVRESYKEVVNLEFHGYPILVDGKLFGVINIYNLEEEVKNNPELLTKDVKLFSVAYVFPDQNLLVVMDKMKKYNLGRLPVVNRFDQSQLIGIITPEDIVSYLGITKS
jgi:CIC family chloride channel protein